MSFLCPFGCDEERNGSKTIPHIIKEHKHQLMEAIQASGTLYSCLKARGEGEPEICCCFGCNTAWKNKTVAAKHFHDEKGKECLTKHKAFLQLLKQDAGKGTIEEVMKELDAVRKELRQTKSKLNDAYMQIVSLKEEANPENKQAQKEVQYLKQYIERFGDLAFNVIRDLMTDEQHKAMSQLDSSNCKEFLHGDGKKVLAEKLQAEYHGNEMVRLRWFPSVDTFLQMKNSEGICYTDYTPWTRTCVLRNWWPKMY
jgi:hypothetical protein